MKISDKTFLPEYNQLIGEELEQLISQFDFSEEKSSLSYSTQASAVFSSNIEGNSLDLNSFMNCKLSQNKTSEKEVVEIDNLIEAYEFAQQNSLTEVDFLHAHKLLSKNLLPSAKQGKYRNDKVGVFDANGLVYLAIEPEFVEAAMHEFFADIQELLISELTIAETFYHASLIHLKLAHIHPFADGNGRAARLIEKWFLAQKGGLSFWKIASEKYYKENQAAYYKNINLGVNYYELNYKGAMPFLQMLAMSLK